jgi:transposase
MVSNTGVRENDGRKLDHQTLEDIRMRSVDQFMNNGATVKDIAATLGLRDATVYGWVKLFKDRGAHALLAKPIPGRPSKLTEDQVRQLYTTLLGKDPRQLGFDFALWTRWMVRELIKRLFEVDLTEQSVGRLLRRLGMSPQRPVTRAYEQDSGAVRHWKTVTFPKIKAEAAEVEATIYFADEAGIRSDYHSHTTWAPVGVTPIVPTTGKRHSVNMLSAVSPAGAVHFLLHEGRADAGIFIDFCERLLQDDGGVVFLVVDNHSIHRAARTKKFVADTQGRLRLFFLPAYSPELNADEWVWKNVKYDRIGRSGITSFSDLHAKVTCALARLQQAPAIVRAFFRDPDLKYVIA